MEKISGIIPASARTLKADVSVAQPARPGAPVLGRPEGKNSLGERVAFSKQLEEFKKAAALQSEDQAQVLTPEASVYKNPTEAKKLKTIEELNKKFFTNPKSEVREGNLTKSEETLKGATDMESLFYVEKELKPTPAPLKEISDNKVV